MPLTAANAINNEILFKTYSYANGKYEEQAVYKEDVMKISLDKVEISKDSPEYETICSQMHSMESLGEVGLNNLFYDSNEIMYDYYDGKLTQDDLKKLVKDYLYYSVGEAEQNNTFQQKRVTAILSRLYEMFTRGNVRNAVNRNHKEGQQFLKEMGLEGSTEFYYNSKWYYACEEIQEMLRETANELSDEYGAEQVDFAYVEKHTRFTLDGGITFNGVWDSMEWQFNHDRAIMGSFKDVGMVPPKDFVYCSKVHWDGESSLAGFREYYENKNSDSSFRMFLLAAVTNTWEEKSLLLDRDNYESSSKWEDNENYQKALAFVKNFNINWSVRTNRFEFLKMG